MKVKFSGTGVALVTPFRKQGTIDFTTLENLVESDEIPMEIIEK